MLVKIYKYWPENASHYGMKLNLGLTRQTPGSSLKWGDIEFTLDENIKECDLLVVLGFTPSNLRIKARQTWIFQQEPPIEDLWGWQKKGYKYFDKVFGFWGGDGMIAEQTSLAWFLNKTYDELSHLEIVNKKDEVSWCTSILYHRPGHIARMDFKDFLLSKGFKLDLFGYGFKEIQDKFDAIDPYKYSIAIENYFTNGYWTEKIADCFLCHTMPIYCGAKDILKYFPKKSLVLIDPSKKEESFEIIKCAIENKLWDKNIDYIKEAKELCLNKYQLFPNIARLIKEHDVMTFEKKECFFPKINEGKIIRKVYGALKRKVLELIQVRTGV